MEVKNKDLDKIMIPYENRLLFLGIFLITKVWDIHISDVNEVPNTITVILD